MLFPAASCAALAAMSMVTIPSAAGVTAKLYVSPLPVKAPTEPFVTFTSLLIKSVTASLKVTVIGIGEALVGSWAVEVISTVGAVVSTATVCGVPKRAETFPTASFAQG